MSDHEKGTASRSSESPEDDNRLGIPDPDVGLTDDQKLHLVREIHADHGCASARVRLTCGFPHRRESWSESWTGPLYHGYVQLSKKRAPSARLGADVKQLCILYLLSFLDRTNIGNAKIAGLVKDLGLSTSGYNAALTIFFVPYAVFEPLTNVLLKRLRPSVFIPIIM